MRTPHGSSAKRWLDYWKDIENKKKDQEEQKLLWKAAREAKARETHAGKKKANNAKKQKLVRPISSSSSESENEEEVTYNDSSSDDLATVLNEKDESSDFDYIQNNTEELPNKDHRNIQKNMWAIVKYGVTTGCNLTIPRYYIGFVLDVTDEGAKVQFARQVEEKPLVFKWPTKDDIEVVEYHQIHDILPEPTKNVKNDRLVSFQFPGYKFSGLKVE